MLGIGFTHKKRTVIKARVQSVKHNGLNSNTQHNHWMPLWHVPICWVCHRRWMCYNKYTFTWQCFKLFSLLLTYQKNKVFHWQAFSGKSNIFMLRQEPSLKGNTLKIGSCVTFKYKKRLKKFARNKDDMFFFRMSVTNEDWFNMIDIWQGF